MAGLEVLHDSPNAKVDIVFVHGLHGDSRNTWKDGSVFWPADLLPANVPDARILTFGYDANIAHFWSRPSDSSLDMFSADLFQQLEHLRFITETTELPIIFVAHSLGGLGLVDAATGPDDTKKLANNVRCIAFLGTPHQGSDKAKWAESAGTFLGYFKTINIETAKNLDPRSDKLAKLGVQFPVLLNSRARTPDRGIEVVCFYEGLSMRRCGIDLGKIVNAPSACLSGYPRMLLDADHEGICKFKDKNNVNYRRVSGQSAKWAKQLSSLEKKDNLRKETSSVYATFEGSTNYGLQLGNNTGTLSGFSFGKA
ncbi:Serine active site containing protein 1 [Arachnomyces sp. PD_36]|nr:Serine active site containing protein 1 [Arachnomyces sp. PD_36]